MMLPEIPAAWISPSDLKEAAKVQALLASRVIEQDHLLSINHVSGADVSNAPRNPAAPIYAAMVSLRADNLSLTAAATANGPAAFPYVPGFLGFREVPWLLNALRDLPALPDLIFVDGHGISHPRRFGIASHLGVLIDRPTIGVAKSIIVGRPERIVGSEPGDHVPLIWRNQTIGLALRTKRGCNPLFISVGHRISLQTALEWVLRCLKGYRLPEPTRQAHNAANAARRANDGLIQPEALF